MIKIDTRVKQETVDIIKKTAKENGRSFCGEIRFDLEQYYNKRNRYDLLVRYMQHVKACDGDSFLNKANSSYSEVVFTTSELKELYSIEEDLKRL